MVSCEQDVAVAEMVVEMLVDVPGDAEAVEVGGASADFVEDDEAFVHGAFDDAGGVDHFVWETMKIFPEAQGRISKWCRTQTAAVQPRQEAFGILSIQRI